jgi:hypothetical protein
LTLGAGIGYWLREFLCAALHLGCSKKDFTVRLGFTRRLKLFVSTDPTGEQTTRDYFNWLKEPNLMSASLNIDLNTDTGGHVASLVALNPDESPATGVTVSFSSDNPQSCDVDSATGALTVGTVVGVANITGTGSRGKFSHSDSGAVTVTQDAATGDFGVTLGLT